MEHVAESARRAGGFEKGEHGYDPAILLASRSRMEVCSRKCRTSSVWRCKTSCVAPVLRGSVPREAFMLTHEERACQPCAPR